MPGQHQYLFHSSLSPICTSTNASIASSILSPTVFKSLFALALDGVNDGFIEISHAFRNSPKVFVVLSFWIAEYTIV